MDIIKGEMQSMEKNYFSLKRQLIKASRKALMNLIQKIRTFTARTD